MIVFGLKGTPMKENVAPFGHLGWHVLFFWESQSSYSVVIPIIFATIRLMATFSPSKIDLFLANQIFQHIFLGMAFHNLFKMGFFLRVPGYCLFQTIRSCPREPGGLKRTQTGCKMVFQTSGATLHWRKRCMAVFESELRREHREGPSIPLLMRLYAIRSLLCINNHIKQLTLGIQSNFQTFFQRFVEATTMFVCSNLYPSLTV